VVISVLLVVAGLAAMRSLPIAQYPEIAPPVVTVQATYPGASAEVIESTVAAPLENAINGLPGMIYMSSNSSSNGVTQIQVTFEIGSDIDSPRSMSATASSRSNRGCRWKCAGRG
jgi:multidrug efflux pump